MKQRLKIPSYEKENWRIGRLIENLGLIFKTKFPLKLVPVLSSGSRPIPANLRGGREIKGKRRDKRKEEKRAWDVGVELCHSRWHTPCRGACGGYNRTTAEGLRYGGLQEEGRFGTVSMER